jgi:hypothetical protein
MTSARLAAIGLLALVACTRHTTGVPACDEHLEHRRACAKQIGGELGADIAREADRLEDLWMGTAKKGVAGWKDKLGKKWCSAATLDAATQFPECRW